MTSLDELIGAADSALRTLSAEHLSSRPYPADSLSMPPDQSALTGPEQALAGALMRVNHVGEVCAQALYSAQALVTGDAAVKRTLAAASKEETDHLAWTEQRLSELGARPSLLNPLWYAGAFGIGLAMAKHSDAISLGFVVETERQVGLHLATHLEKLPASDTRSRVIVQQMMKDEAQHAAAAQEAGARPLPQPIKAAMLWAAKLMTTVAHKI